MKTSSFGAKLRALREEKKLGLRELAGKAGISPAFLSKIESGKEKPPAEQKLRALAKELDCDPDVLLATAGRLPGDVMRIIQKHPRQYVALLRTLRSRSAKQLQVMTSSLHHIQGIPSLTELKEIVESSEEEFSQVAAKLSTVERRRKAGGLAHARIVAKS